MFRRSQCKRIFENNKKQNPMKCVKFIVSNQIWFDILNTESMSENIQIDRSGVQFDEFPDDLLKLRSSITRQYKEYFVVIITVTHYHT